MPEPAASDPAASDAVASGALAASPLPAHNWKWFLLRGVLMILLGLVALVAPGLTLFAFAAVFAVYSFIDGIAGLISGLRGAGHHAPRWITLVLTGLAGIAVGVLFVVWPLISTAVYAAVVVALIATWAIVTGALQVVAAIRLRREIKGEWLLALVGALTFALGVWLFAQLWMEPMLTLLAVGWLIGFWAIISGVSLIALSLRLRRSSATG